MKYSHAFSFKRDSGREEVVFFSVGKSALEKSGHRSFDLKSNPSRVSNHVTPNNSQTFLNMD